ncbi:MAG: hypothetical protein AB7N80_03155 [Bdellovibrionales bacterium]
MRHLNIFALIFFVSSLARANSGSPQKCDDVTAAVGQVLNRIDAAEPAAAAAVLQQAAHSTSAPAAAAVEDAYKAMGIRVRDPAGANYASQIIEDSYQLETKATRALAAGGQQEAAARAAIGHKLNELTEASKGADINTLERLKRQKASLLRLSYLNKRKLESLSTDELVALEKKIEGLFPRGEQFSPPAHLLAEKEFLKEITAALAKKPDYMDAKRRAIAAIGQQQRAQDKAREMTYRTSHALDAARPLTTKQVEVMGKAIEAMKKDPAALTPDQVRWMTEMREQISAKQKWKDGDYRGMTSEDEARVTEFVRAWDDAVGAISRRTKSMEALAAEQGRRMGPALSNRQVQDTWGQNTGRRAASSRGELDRRAHPEADRIVETLQLASPGSSATRLREVVNYNPVVTRQAGMNSLAEQLGPLGVTRQQLESANVLSAIDPTNVGVVLNDLERAREFLRHVETAENRGQLSVQGNRELRQLVDTVRFHVNSYVPPHLQRLGRYND